MPKTKIIDEPPVKVSEESDVYAGKMWLFWVFVKATILAVAFVLITFIIGLGIFTYAYGSTIARHAGMSLTSLYYLGAKGWSTQVTQTDGRKNILILGVDSLESRASLAVNTDTIMVASLNLSRGQVTTFSIPRDLFLTEQKVKINGLYARELKAKNPVPELVTKRAVEQLTGLPIHHVLVLEIEEVGRLIDALGGVEVVVPRSFTDSQFPREGIDPESEKNPSVLFKTVTFTAGTERMNGERALEFIRSRHSTDPIEGSDDARAKRQQLVIEALVKRLSDKTLVKHPGYIGDLIKLYEADFQKFLPLEEMIGVGRIFLTLRRMPEFTAQHLGVKGFDDNPVLYHPATFYTKQWVYLLIDPSGQQLKMVIADWFK